MENKTVEKRGNGHPVRALVVMNPVSGVSDADEVHTAITRFCAVSGWDCLIHETKPDEDLREIVRNEVKNGIDVAIAAGGDGTVAAVVNGLVNSRIPLGILPMGTGNNLARDLSIPLPVEEALALIGSAERQLQVLDVIKVGDQHFVLNVSIGASAETMQNTPREEKRRYGFLAYLYRAFGTLSNLTPHTFNVEVDGQKLSFEASELMITNEKFMGLQPQLEGVEVDANDGQLDLFIVQAETLPEYVRVLSRFFVPADQNEETALHYIPIREMVRIESDEPLIVQADGEVIGETPVEISVVRGGLHVIVPPETAEARAK